jgi:prepilin-type processing-associated H-X9-DG protein
VFERHRGVINVSFCDGHVEAIDEEGLRLKVWRRQ